MVPEHTLNRATRQASKAIVIGVAILIASSCDGPNRPTAPSGKTGAAAPSFTIGMGSTPTFLGQGTYSDFLVKTVSKDWEVQLKAQKGLEVVVRSFAYQPHSFTGWHQHPGPVLIQIIEGTVTFYEADAPCTPIVVHAGEGYVDTGSGHMGRNLTDLPAKDITINFAPPGTALTGLRIDMPEPEGAEKCR
jgi:hypothetical protein